MLCAALALATFAAYSRAPSLGFIAMDDEPYVTQNPDVAAGLTSESARWAFTGTAAGNWHPLTMLSLMLDHDLSASNPCGYHLTNVLFHVANTLLLFILLQRLTGARGCAAFVAGLFAIHPLHVESVAWISSRKDVLCAFFWLLSLLAYVRYARTPNMKNYLAVAAAFGLSLMSKPVAVTLPIALLLLDYWPLDRRSLGAGRLLCEKIPLFGMSLALGLATLWAQGSVGAISQLQNLSFSVRLSNALVAYVSYLGKMLWPVGLAVFYPHPGASLPHWEATAAAILLLGLTFIAIKNSKARPHLLFGWLWYIITLLPMAGLIQVGGHAMADRYTYIPLIGVFIALAWEIRKLASPLLLKPLAISLLGILGMMTFIQTGTWENDETVWQRAIAVTPPNAVAQFNLATVLEKQKRHGEALEHFLEAVRIDPSQPKSYSAIGQIEIEQGRLASAEDWLRRGLRIAPNDVEANANMGVALSQQKKYREALTYYERALQSGERTEEVRRLYDWTKRQAALELKK